MQDCFEDHGGKRTQSLGEEIANSISHGVGLIAALMAAPFLIWVAARKGELLTIVAVSIFATSMVLLYLSSMMYHCLPRNAGEAGVWHFRSHRHFSFDRRHAIRLLRWSVCGARWAGRFSA